MATTKKRHSERIIIPKPLEHSLEILYATEKKALRRERLIKSLAQELIYNCSNGTKKTIKHVELGLCVNVKPVLEYLLHGLVVWDTVSHIMRWSLWKKALRRNRSIISRRQHSYQVPLGLLNLERLFMTMEILTVNPCTISHTTAQMLPQFKDRNILCYLTVQKAPHVIQEKNDFKTRQRSFKPVIEPPEPAIEKVRSDPSLVSNIDINNGLIHKAVAITEDLLWRM